MPQSIPKGITAEHVLRALTDLDAGMHHPFGPSTGYELAQEGRRYPPMAAIGQADCLLKTTRMRTKNTAGAHVGTEADEPTYHPINELSCLNAASKRSRVSIGIDFANSDTFSTKYLAGR